MTKKILITGGAGFVGSHTADALVTLGHDVRIYDSLSPQVHPDGLPGYLTRDVEFIKGDIRNLEQLSAAVRDVDVIYHLAAVVGVGQSMYQIADYTEVNIQGTANLLQAILDTKAQIEKVVVASSMSIYGEGRYLCPNCGPIAPRARSIDQLKQKRWETLCPTCGTVANPVATDEEKPLQSTSVYALSKKNQEEIVLLFGKTYNVPTVAFRYFNIYGSRQALSNPYTGVAAIFASRLMNGKSPLVFEDGEQLRDFVSVHDIVQANVLALESCGGDGMALNVGSGNPISVRQVATEIGSRLGVEVPLDITGKYRMGDIRHCFADISKISGVLGYRPKTQLHDGMSQLVEWLKSQEAQDHTSRAYEQLTGFGLVA